ncbi:uncharacterized protein LOC135279647 [Passer domesticus]|uniref:uncharacterized protein LOC135279647 n=1 Tax=Passer domesticus TaxID=48849 RepID=UPI0030FEED97
MGNNLSKEEESVLATWKVLLRNKGIFTSDYALQSLLLWAKSQGFGTDPGTAYSVKAWKKVGDRLWEVIRAGDKSVVDLAVTWGSLFEALKQWKTEQKQAERDVDEESGLTIETDGGDEADGASDGELAETVLEEGAGAVEVARQATKASGKAARVSRPAAKASGKAARASGLDAKASGKAAKTSGKAAKASGRTAKTSGQTAVASPYQTPKPLYLTPAQQLTMVPVYDTPLRQLAELSLAERETQPSAPPLPSALVQPSAPPLRFQLHEQSARSYPPLPSSDSESSDESPAVTPELGQGTLVSLPFNSSSPTAPWTLPPCQVTVLPRHPQEFWEFVRKKAVEENNWDIIERLGPPKVPQEKSADVIAACTNPMAFPVFKAAPGTRQDDSHHVFA